MAIFPNALQRPPSFESHCTAETGKGHAIPAWTRTSAPSLYSGSRKPEDCSFPWQTALPQAGRSQTEEQRRYPLLGQVSEPWLWPRAAAGSGFACWIIELFLCATAGRANGASLSEMKGKSREFPSLPSSRDWLGSPCTTAPCSRKAGIWEKDPASMHRHWSQAMWLWSTRLFSLPRLLGIAHGAQSAAGLWVCFLMGAALRSWLWIVNPMQHPPPQVHFDPPSQGQDQSKENTFPFHFILLQVREGLWN